MFPAAPAAKASIDFDSHGFLINGKRTFIVSAGMEYARVPRALWRDRLLRLKRAGFNCVEMYNFWDWHEPQEGKFDFTGDHDLDAYLKLVKQMGMYAICRVGPYYCAEWDSGGYPLWLHFKPGMRVRADDPQFEAAVDRFFDKLIPIVAANQINHGGSVILVQLENEHPAGLGHGDAQPLLHAPAGQGARRWACRCRTSSAACTTAATPASDTAMDDPNRPNPWFTTEFWSVWFSQYGPKPDDARLLQPADVEDHRARGQRLQLLHGPRRHELRLHQRRRGRRLLRLRRRRRPGRRPAARSTTPSSAAPGSPARSRTSWKTARTRRPSVQGAGLQQRRPCHRSRRVRRGPSSSWTTPAARRPRRR